MFREAIVHFVTNRRLLAPKKCANIGRKGGAVVIIVDIDT